MKLRTTTTPQIFTKLLIIMMILGSLNTAFAERVQISVNRNIELLCIIQHVAGRYGEPVRSSYLKEVNAYFKPYKDHPAVKKIQEIMPADQPDGALPDLGYYLTEPALEWKYELPEEATVLYEAWYGMQNLNEYFALARDFANVSNYQQFYDNHKVNYLKWAAELNTAMVRKKIHSAAVPTFEEFFNIRKEWAIFLKPLSNGGSHAIADMPEINEEQRVFSISYFKRHKWQSKIVKGVTGKKKPYSNWKTDPIFNGDNPIEKLLLHEGAHFQTTFTYRAYADRINSWENLKQHGRDRIQQTQGYTDFVRTIDENIVRAIETYLQGKLGMPKEDVASKLISQQHLGFYLIKEVYALIEQFEQEKGSYASFAAFAPVIMDRLEQLDKESQTNDLLESFESIDMAYEKILEDHKSLFDK